MFEGTLSWAINSMKEDNSVPANPINHPKKLSPYPKIKDSENKLISTKMKKPKNLVLIF